VVSRPASKPWLFLSECSGHPVGPCVSVRIKLVIQRETKFVYRWVGAILPVWKRSRTWSAFSEVLLQKVERSSDGHRSLNYTVVVKGPSAELTSPYFSSVHESRRAGRQVAIAMGLPLRDTVKDTLTPCEKLRGGLQQRLSWKADEFSTTAPPPPGARVTCLERTLEIRLDPRGQNFGRQFIFYAQLAAGMFLFGPMGYTVLLLAFKQSTEPAMRLLALPFLLAVVGGILWLRQSYWQGRRESESEEETKLSPSGLVSKKTWRGNTVSRSVPIEEIDDLELDVRGVVILTGSEPLYLASGAKKADQSWLLSVLQAHLVSIFRPQS